MRDLDALLRAIRRQHSSNPIDKVCAIAFPFKKHESFNYNRMTLPIYDPSTPVSIAWEQLISSIASTEMEIFDLPSVPNSKRDDLMRVCQTSTVQLLCLFPHPSRYHWFPSWAQVQKYPDVSVRDNDSVLIAGGMDYSLHIRSGRIYQSFSLQLNPTTCPQQESNLLLHDRRQRYVASCYITWG